jgi:hypothetical protein
MSNAPVIPVYAGMTGIGGRDETSTCHGWKAITAPSPRLLQFMPHAPVIPVYAGMTGIGGRDETSTCHGRKGRGAT